MLGKPPRRLINYIDLIYLSNCFLFNFPCHNPFRYGWKTQFIQSVTNDTNSNSHSTEIENLTQNTQYAYYVKTQVVPKDHEEEVFGISQGQSSIKYFTTKPNIPTFPDVETMSKTNVSLTLTWSPIIENDLIDYYKVDVFIQPDEHAFLDLRDYCLHPRVEMHVSIGVEVNVSPSTIYQSCNAEFENWKINHPDAVDPEYEWRKHRKAVCSEQSSRVAHDERQLQVMRYVKNHEIHICGNDRRCYERNNFDSFRFSRQIHNFVKLSDSSSSIDEGNEMLNLGANHLHTVRFSSTTLNGTFFNLLPYTMYIFQFFACNKISCSSYFLYFDRTDSSIYADDMTLTILIDPSNSNKVHLDFSEPPSPNGLTVAFMIEKHDLSNFELTTYCVSRKDHYENGRRYSIFGFWMQTIE